MPPRRRKAHPLRWAGVHEDTGFGVPQTPAGLVAQWQSGGLWSRRLHVRPVPSLLVPVGSSLHSAVTGADFGSLRTGTNFGVGDEGRRTDLSGEKAA